MKTYIALLRGINVGGHNMIKMADLKKIFEALNFQNVSTFIQSGNVIFQNKAVLNEEKVQQDLQRAIEKKYGFQVPVTVISKKLFKKIVEENPYVHEGINVNSLHVTFFNAPQKALGDMDQTKYAPDVFMATPHAVYLQLLNPYHKTKLSNAFFERKANVTATTRNWKTVCTLLELAMKLND